MGICFLGNHAQDPPGPAMLGYLKGVREYNDAHRKGINRDAVVQMLTQATAVKDPAMWA